jgi:hypothetical protein
MDTIRAVDINKCDTIPPTAESVSLSKASEFPVPFDRMCPEAIKGLTLSKSTNSTRFDINEILFEFHNS